MSVYAGAGNRAHGPDCARACLFRGLVGSVVPEDSLMRLEGLEVLAGHQANLEAEEAWLEDASVLAGGIAAIEGVAVWCIVVADYMMAASVVDPAGE